MKRAFKAPLTFPVSIAFILLTFQSFGQPRGMTMTQVFNQVNKQTMNQQMQMQMQMNMIMNANWRSNVGQGTDFQVTFKDSSVMDVTSFLYTDTVSHNNFLVYENKKFHKSDSAHRYQKIYSDQTLYIAVNAKSNTIQPSYGVPLDSCWMFKVVSGAVNVYSKYPELYSELSTKNTNANQTSKDVPMVKYSELDLMKMVGQDRDAAELINKKKFYKAVMKYNANVIKAAKKINQ